MDTSARSEYQARARFFNVDDAFNVKRPPISPRIFEAERDAAFESSTKSQQICDLREQNRQQRACNISAYACLLSSPGDG